MASVPFPPVPQSVRRVRQMIRRELPFVDTLDVELVASELVSNVIRHANTEFEVSLEIDEDKVRLEVSDGSSIMPAIQDLSDDHRTGGRGLRLVEAICERWGAEQRPDGKVVWAEISIGPEHER